MANLTLLKGQNIYIHRTQTRKLSLKYKCLLFKKNRKSKRSVQRSCNITFILHNITVMVQII